jgi:hypothetical protein
LENQFENPDILIMVKKFNAGMEAGSWLPGWSKGLDHKVPNDKSKVFGAETASYLFNILSPLHLY